jgi:heme/copper-type cytochrome/quinol oxidase subunit 2
MTSRLAFPLFLVTVIGGQIGGLGISWAQVAEQRHFTIAAVEPRGGATVGQEPVPTERLPPGPGYVLRQPDQTGRWEVSVYLWSPSQIVVHQGDEVTLDFVGINGASHPTEIKGLDKAFTLKRGHVVRVEFKAERPGTYSVICNTHVPSMRAEIVVLPRT